VPPAETGGPTGPDGVPATATPGRAEGAGSREVDRPVPTTGTPGPPGPPRRMAALDGLRAVAVIAVLLYHAGVGWIPGGLLGVDVFFVLSGFLITGLLIAEWDAHRRIDLRRFWVRRARRLLPALVMVLLAVVVYARLGAPAQARGIRADALATVFYVANWRFAISDQSYFASLGAPSPLLHTWSLAVEEQFYVLWPLVVVLVMRHGPWTSRMWRLRRRRAQTTLLAVAAAAAGLSALLAGMYSATGIGESRIYYGTDTRAQALLAGACLAVARVRRAGPGAPQPAGVRDPRALELAGVAALLALTATLMTVDGQSVWLYRGGFLAVAGIVAVLVGSLADAPDGPAARLLCVPPARYVGRISYGLYLWHWPVFMVMTAHRTGLAGGALLTTRLATTAVIAAASFHLVENPIRVGTPRLPRPAVLLPAAAGALVLVIALVTVPASAPASEASAIARLTARENAEAAAQAQAEPVRAVRTLVVGDSVAVSLGFGLSDAARARPADVDVVDKGILGCGVARGPEFRLEGAIDRPQPQCPRWPSLYQQDVDRYDPDVAVLLVGRWEITDRVLDGRWTHIGDQLYDLYLAGELDLAIRTLSSRGARVMVLTTPVFEPGEAANGSMYPETDPARIAQFNDILRAAVARRSTVASLFDLNAVLSPGGTYHATIGGQSVWMPDGIHLTDAGGKVVARTLLPAIVATGGPVAARRPAPASAAPAAATAASGPSYPAASTGRPAAAGAPR